MDDLFGTKSPGVDNTFDYDRAASAFPDIDLDGNTDIPVATNGANNLVDDDLLFGGGTQTNVKVTGDDELDKFESAFPELDTPVVTSAPAAQPSRPTFGTSNTPQPYAPRPQQAPSSFATPVLQQQFEQEEEPEVIKQWREKQEEEIRQREEAAAAKKAETRAKAERAIDDFYTNYNAKNEKTIKQNKDDERAFLDQLNAGLSEGTTWSRIADYLELQNSQSKTLARPGVDLSRFKEVLLRLKREGDSAPGAGGY